MVAVANDHQNQSQQQPTERIQQMVRGYSPDTQDPLREESRAILRDIFLDDYAQKCAIQRATFAAGYGIDPRPFSQPLKGSTTTTNNLVERESKLSPLAAAALGAALMAAGAGGGLGLAGAVGALGGKQAESELEPFEGQIEFWTEDGTKISNS